MTKDPQIYLDQIVEAIEIIEKYTLGMSKSDFLKPSAQQDGVILRLEIIGEATRAMPEEFRNSHPEIPWRKIGDFRNKLIHDYFGTDFDLVWNILKNDLPKFKRRLQKLAG